MKTIAEIVLAGETLAPILEDFTVIWSDSGRKKAGANIVEIIENAISPDGAACLAIGQITYQCLLLKDDLEMYGKGLTLGMLVDLNYGVESDVLDGSDVGWW